MKRRMVKATIDDGSIYAEVEGHVDAVAYEGLRQGGDSMDTIPMRVVKVLKFRIYGSGGTWVSEIDKQMHKGNLEQLLRNSWLSGAHEPHVFFGELDDLGIEFVQPPREQPSLLEVPS